ncbi:MAG: hypothetical protein ACK520_07980 [Inhella sp.]|nr:hypothetical protein [Inhella sp.]
MAWLGLAIVLVLAADMALLALQRRGWSVQRPWADWHIGSGEPQRERRRQAVQHLRERRSPIACARDDRAPETQAAMAFATLSGRHNRA